MENQFFSDTFEGIQDYVMGGEVTAAEAVTLLTDLADKCRTLAEVGKDVAKNLEAKEWKRKARSGR